MPGAANKPVFRKPSRVEAIFNGAFGFVVGLGMGPSYMYLLQVKGRRTGRNYSLPVNLLEFQGKKFLVAPRGRTQWVRNAEASDQITLRKGKFRRNYRLRPLADSDKLEILKLYLDSYKSAVQRYFSIPAGSPPDAFRNVAADYPVFELIPS